MTEEIRLYCPICQTEMPCKDLGEEYECEGCGYVMEESEYPAYVYKDWNAELKRDLENDS